MSDQNARATQAPPTTPPAAPPARASDADRHDTVRVLQDAVARGLLTPDEGGERMAAAFAARFRSELPLLTADLPPAVDLAPAAPGWRPLAGMAVLQARAGVAALTADGFRSRRALAAAGALLVVLLVVVLLGAAGLHLLVDGSHGHGDFPGGR